MKKAKQILSLMLVVAMVLGMMVFTTGTASAKNIGDYTDNESITYREAVDVITALGIMVGNEGETTFLPTDTFTREMAAKVMTYISIGSGPAAALLGTSVPSTFTDVDQTRWSNPYIQHCVNNGIIVGYGDGTFGPEDPVTAAQLAKMLLVTLGYGKKGEFSDPNTWLHNAIVLGQQTGILTTVNDFTQPATREEIALYAFNALKQVTVSYNEVFNEYTNTSSLVAGGTANPTLGRKVFNLVAYGSNEVFGTNGNNVFDDFGRNVREWRVGQTPITGNYSSENVLGSFVNSGMETKGSMFSSYTWPAATTGTVDVWVNGVVHPAQPVDDYALRGANDYMLGHGWTSIFPAGSFIEIVDATNATNDGTDNVVDKIVVTTEYLARVASVQAAAGTVSLTAYYNSNNAYGAPANNTAATKPIPNVKATGFAVGDYVLVVPNNVDAFYDGTGAKDPLVASTDVLSIKAAESVKGTLTASSLFGYTVSGQLYSESGAISDDNKFEGPFAAPITLAFGAEYTLYLDSHGYVLLAYTEQQAAAALNYVYLYDIDSTAQGSFNGAELKVSVAFTDGKKQILNVPVRTTSGDVTVPDPNGGAALSLLTNTTAVDAAYTPGWYSYTINTTTGMITLTRAAAASTFAGTAIDLTAKVANVTTILGLATKTTVFSRVLGGTHSTVTGFANFPTASISGGNVQVLVVYAQGSTPNDAGGIITHIYVIDDYSSALTKYGVVLGTGTTDAEGTEYRIQTADGEIVIKDAAGAATAGQIVEVYNDGTFGPAVTNVTAAETVQNITTGWVETAASGTFIFDENCVFVDASNVFAVTADARPANGDTVDYVTDGASTILAIVVK